MVVWHLARTLAFAAQANGTSSSANGQAAAQEVSALEVSRLLAGKHKPEMDICSCYPYAVVTDSRRCQLFGQFQMPSVAFANKHPLQCCLRGALQSSAPRQGSFTARLCSQYDRSLQCESQQSSIY